MRGRCAKRSFPGRSSRRNTRGKKKKNDEQTATADALTSPPPHRRKNRRRRRRRIRIRRAARDDRGGGDTPRTWTDGRCIEIFYAVNRAKFETGAFFVRHFHIVHIITRESPQNCIILLLYRIRTVILILNIYKKKSP